MRLDRNVKDRCKYALIKLRDIEPLKATLINGAPESVMCYIIPAEAVVKCSPEGNPEDEFFVIKLRDAFAAPALKAYAKAASHWDGEYAVDVMALAHKAENMKDKKFPD